MLRGREMYSFNSHFLLQKSSFNKIQIATSVNANPTTTVNSDAQNKCKKNSKYKN